MGALTRLALGAAALAAAAVAAVLLVGRDSSAPGVRTPTALSVRATITPPLAGFGDRLVARVAVLVDPSAVDSRRVHLNLNLAPLTPLARLRARRSAQAIVVELPVSCLAVACTSSSGAQRVVLPAVQVDAPRRGGGIVRAETRWPVLEVRGRVLSSEVDVRRAPRFRANLSLPALRYRISPGTLAPLLDVLAVLLALGGLALAAREAALRFRRPRTAEADELGRALALARESGSRPASDRRRALGLVARLLGDREEPLSSPVSELAWSRAQPSRDKLSELVERVSREVKR